MELKFTKMHGAGNNFVVLDATTAPFALSATQLLMSDATGEVHHVSVARLCPGSKFLYDGKQSEILVTGTTEVIAKADKGETVTYQ